MSEMHATVLEVKRIQSTKGNPRYSFKTGRGWVRMAPNTVQNYAVTNDFREGEALDIDVKFTLNGRGHVIDWEI